jgi:hypothetical protein
MKLGNGRRGVCFWTMVIDLILENPRTLSQDRSFLDCNVTRVCTKRLCSTLKVALVQCQASTTLRPTGGPESNGRNPKSQSTRSIQSLDDVSGPLGISFGSLSHHGWLVRSTISRAATGRHKMELKTGFWKRRLACLPQSRIWEHQGFSIKLIWIMDGWVLSGN